MKEQLISFKIAKLAKEKGFNISCKGRYGLQSTILYSDYGFHINDEDDIIHISAPTQSLLQAWLRDKHNIIVNSIPYEDEIPECEGGIRQTLWEDETIDCREIPWLRDITTHTYYHSFEEALEKALFEGLKLITK